MSTSLANIRDLYLELLLREPDPREYDQWLLKLRDGMSVDDVRRWIQRSRQYEARWKPWADPFARFDLIRRQL